MNAYPEHEKLTAIKEKSQAGGELLEWLLCAKNLVLCEQHEHAPACYCPIDHAHTEACEDVSGKPCCGLLEGSYYPTPQPIVRLLEEHFGIDRQRLAEEKEALLASLRSHNHG